MSALTPHDSSSEKQQHLAFLYLVKEELDEAIRFASALLKREWIIDGGEHEAPEVRALDIALVVTYSRPFKRNYGFSQVKPLLDRAISSYSGPQRELHESIIKMRDREYAHADADAHDVQVHFDNMFAFSKLVTREPLQRANVEQLIDMCGQLIASIEEQIAEHRSELKQSTCGTGSSNH